MLNHHIFRRFNKLKLIQTSEYVRMTRFGYVVQSVKVEPSVRDESLEDGCQSVRRPSVEGGVREITPASDWGGGCP